MVDKKSVGKLVKRLIISLFVALFLFSCDSSKGNEPKAKSKSQVQKKVKNVGKNLVTEEERKECLKVCRAYLKRNRYKKNGKLQEEEKWKFVKKNGGIIIVSSYSRMRGLPNDYNEYFKVTLKDFRVKDCKYYYKN